MKDFIINLRRAEGGNTKIVAKEISRREKKHIEVRELKLAEETWQTVRLARCRCDDLQQQ